MNSPPEIIAFAPEHVAHVMQWDVLPQWSSHDWHTATRLRAIPEFEALTVMHAGRVVGVIVADARWETGIAVLRKLLVAPDSRRKGLATAMLEWLRKATRRAGLTLVADVHESLTPMHCFLRKAGFVGSVHPTRCGVYHFEEREPETP